MKNLSLTLLLLSFYMIASSQSIRGVIFDKITKEKVCFATVYLDGTFLGTTSDLDGKFAINIPHDSFMPITVSSVGYFSTTVSDFSSDNPLTIHLKPKTYLVQEINVSDNSLVRKRKINLKLFNEVFLGTTNNALSCKITNEQDISFNYESDRDTLVAFASKPILISNILLGYNVSYYLDKFEYYRKNNTFLFKGNIIFNKDLASESKEKLVYEKRRQTAYLGSRMHFFRSLWTNDLKANGFTVMNSYDEKLQYENIIIQEANKRLNSKNAPKKFFTFPAKLQVSYSTDLSEVIFIQPKVRFDKRGCFDLGINWEGEMAIMRTGDKLPYEYQAPK